MTKYVELEVGEPSAVDNANEVNTEQEHSVQCEQEQSDEQTLSPVSTQSSPRRSTRSKQRPDWYSHHVASLSTEELDPSTVHEVQSSPNSTKCKKAMEQEMKSLHSNKVWELVEPPPD